MDVLTLILPVIDLPFDLYVERCVLQRIEDSVSDRFGATPPERIRVRLAVDDWPDADDIRSIARGVYIPRTHQLLLLGTNGAIS